MFSISLFWEGEQSLIDQVLFFGLFHAFSLGKSLFGSTMQAGKAIKTIEEEKFQFHCVSCRVHLRCLVIVPRSSPISSYSWKFKDQVCLEVKESGMLRSSRVRHGWNSIFSCQWKTDDQPQQQQPLWMIPFVFSWSKLGKLLRY